LLLFNSLWTQSGNFWVTSYTADTDKNCDLL